MKARHVAARIGNASVWSKIFAGILAITLLMLMVPNGLRANAANSVAEQNTTTTDLQQGEVKTQTEQETLNAFKAKYDEAQNLAAVNGEAGWWTLNSDVTFVPSSYNATETAGHFIEQKASVSLIEAFDYFVRMGYVDKDMAFPQSIDELKAMFQNVEQQFDPRTRHSFIEGLLNNFETIPTTGNVFEDLSDALIIFDDWSSNKSVYDEFNTFRIAVRSGKVAAWDLPNNDGSISFMTVTLGDGDNIIDIIKNGSINAVRVIPEIPLIDWGLHTVDNGLLGAEAVSVPENVQAYFSNWSISLDGVNYIPVTWVMEMFESNALSILPYTHYFFKANFWDVEGLVPVHLDFNGAYLSPAFRQELQADGWYTTDFVNGSYWTKAYFEWIPTWAIYSHIFTEFSDAIWGLNEDNFCCVYKDPILQEIYYRSEGDSVYPGPCWLESDNENYYGTLDKETTLSFSTYAVSPRGHVVHETNSLFKSNLELVDNAYVMFYNEYDWPLFRFDEMMYDDYPSGYEEKMYSFAEEVGGTPRYDYCYDTQIDHATVYATSSTLGNYYLPLYVDIDNVNPIAAGMMDEGYLDFNVEKIMYADVNTFMLGDAIDNIQINYFQDGKQLFDTYTITDPWQMMMLSMPLVTNGTLTTWSNTIVSKFDSYIDFVHPFGDVDMLNAFSADNFEASPVSHWYQCQIIVNPKAGYTFNNWTYDYFPFSTTDDNPYVVGEPMFMPNHTIGMNISKPAAAVAADDADNAAIYGEAVSPAAANVVLASDGAATATNTGTAQTGDSMGFAFAIIAMIALASASVFAGRKLYTK